MEEGDTSIVAVERLVGVYKHGKSVQDAVGAIMKRAKDRVSEVIAETGQMEWDTESGKVYVPKPSSSVRYDAAALDALCDSNDELARILRPHRRETQREGSVTIR